MSSASSLIQVSASVARHLYHSKMIHVYKVQMNHNKSCQVNVLNLGLAWVVWSRVVSSGVVGS